MTHYDKRSVGCQCIHCINLTRPNSVDYVTSLSSCHSAVVQCKLSSSPTPYCPFITLVDWDCFTSTCLCATMYVTITNLRENDFCRAMLCISAAHAVVRCLSVCPSRSCIVSKRLKIRSQLLWNANRKPYPSFRIVLYSMTLSELQPRFQGHTNIGRRICQ